jgi:hypothetical protein
MPKATLANGRKVDYDGEVFDRGSMKDVHLVKGGHSVLCFYRDEAVGRDPARRERLDAILGRFNPTVPRARGGAAVDEDDARFFRDLFCWPTAVVVRPRLGFLAPFYPSNFRFESGPDFLKGRPKVGTRFFGPKNRRQLQKHLPGELGTWDKYLALCIRMARGVARLHNAGLAHSDLSPSNVLVDPSTGRCIILDIDALVVPGLYTPDVLGTHGYIAPEVIATLNLRFDDPKRRHPGIGTDQHALAVLIYQYLLLRHPLEGRRCVAAASGEEQSRLLMGPLALFCEHPADPSNRPAAEPYVPCAALGGYLEPLFRRAFVDGLHDDRLRPTALEWLGALVKTRDLLRPCPDPGCEHRWFVVNPAAPSGCPFCGAPLREEVYVLKLHREAQRGIYQPDGQLVLYPDAPLRAWHVHDNVAPDPAADGEPLARVRFLPERRRWCLVNERLTSLSTDRGGRVPVGSALDLRDGARLRLSHEPHGRIAEVKLLRH